MNRERQRVSAAERRDLIRRGAMQAFAERGYEGASMGEIAQAAGITPAVIYDHFSSKAELQIELLERQTAELLGFVGEALQNAPQGLEERMRVGVDAFFRFAEEHSFAWRMLFRDPPTDPGVAAAYRRLDRQATVGITAFIEASAGEALAGEDVPPRAAEMFAEMLKNAQNGLASWWYEHPEVPREEIVQRLLQFCWTGLAQLASRDQERV
jgi:AcrR family transcriptional regulator